MPTPLIFSSYLSPPPVLFLSTPCSLRASCKHHPTQEMLWRIYWGFDKFRESGFLPIIILTAMLKLLLFLLHLQVSCFLLFSQSFLPSREESSLEYRGYRTAVPSHCMGFAIYCILPTLQLPRQVVNMLACNLLILELCSL